MTTIYFFDKDTNEFVKTGEIADRDPVPQYATTVEPGSPQDNTVYVWDDRDEVWLSYPDYRGTYMYDTTSGARYKITEIGQVVGQGFTTIEPPDAESVFPTNYNWDGQQWVIDQQDVDAKLAAVLRIRRNALLLATDWTQLSDVPIAPNSLQDFKDYRKSLRDLPSQEGWPQSVSMPNAPTYSKQ